MKYCRLENGVVVEIFDYNPFEWIPNDAFLSNCKSCPEEVKIGWIYKDEQFLDPHTIPQEPTIYDYLVDLDFRLMLIELGL